MFYQALYGMYKKTRLSTLKWELSCKVRFARLKQIHCETYFFDEVWSLIKLFPNASRVTWFIMTPANSEFFEMLYGWTKNDLEKKMGARAKWMNEHDYPIGLHIHFYRKGNMPTEQKRQMFTEAIDFGAKNQIVFKKFVPGWECYTPDLKELCESLNLQLMKIEESIHDYELEKFKKFFRKQTTRYLLK